ncbi:hypothetical protein OIO90_001101 [Microbotryomycetes sp. JL221]|nr:hypothetical protein OIO90_001101 [Microbotryomycetes sp. JL221]
MLDTEAVAYVDETGPSFSLQEPAQIDNLAFNSNDHHVEEEETTVQTRQASVEPIEPLDTAGSHTVPQGARYCSGCRRAVPEDQFVPNRKQCIRHKRPRLRQQVQATADLVTPPQTLTASRLRSTLAQASQSYGLDGYVGWCRLSTLPGFSMLDSVSESFDDKSLRTRMRALLDLIYDCAKYSFVYKDTRTSRKPGHWCTLRYVCAQRVSADQAQRQSVEKISKEDRYHNVAESLKAAAGADASTTVVQPGMKSNNEPPQAKRMERFDCKGVLTAKILNDGDTVNFSISHTLKHAAYVDVAGNRLRRLTTKHVPFKLPMTLSAPPDGSVEAEGRNDYERMEAMCHGLLDLVKDLEERTHGDEDLVMAELYRKSEPLRRYKASIVEALKRAPSAQIRVAKDAHERNGKRKRQDKSQDSTLHHRQSGSGSQVEGSMTDSDDGTSDLDALMPPFVASTSASHHTANTSNQFELSADEYACPGGERDTSHVRQWL